MRAPTVVLALLVLAVAPLAAQERNVVVNRVRLTAQQVSGFESRWSVRVQDGRYWYDRRSGAWGMDGGPTAGWILAGLDLGGPLPADASRGTSGVFINGRELPEADVSALLRITPVYQGRWWVDAQGSFGAEGGPALGNLWVLARQRGMRPGQAWSVYANQGNNFIAGDDNGCTYFSSRDNGTGTSTSWASPGC
ncbi:MAG: hypothetical protein SF070_03855 [Gemmatimonadota bacterium]|nr:hypothetical protein [Gemmatimonadota bacterium]